ncbi:MFS general substrate transporter [Mycena chlorophos]|uniref:MFS general substrate transporter n=1 Tax=Mycena chlorophos TaxID=658473 RepID=A0A8H6S6T2_MYCCL|nr:MFS general substrate transporter [Mycena chlorophos]
MSTTTSRKRKSRAIKSKSPTPTIPLVGPNECPPAGMRQLSAYCGSLDHRLAMEDFEVDYFNLPTLRALPDIKDVAMYERRSLALKLGSSGLRKDWLVHAPTATRRMFRTTYSDVLQQLDDLLEEMEWAPLPLCANLPQYGYRLSPSKYRALRANLKALRVQAQPQFAQLGREPPDVPSWSCNGRAEDLHSWGDFELTAGNTGGATPLPVAAADQLVKSVSRLSLLTVARSVDEFCPLLAHDTLQPQMMPNFVGTPVESKSDMDALTLSSSDSDELSYPDGGSRAWLIVLGASASTFSTFGYVFQTFYQLHLLKDNSTSEISWIGSVQIALTFGLAIFVGRLFDNGWFALPAFCASVALVALTIITGECTKFWQFLLCQGFAIGVASGIIFGPTLAIVSHWFKRRRSTALGIVAAGSSVGGLIIPILVQQLIPQIGFNWTMRVLALLLLFTTGIMNLCLKRRLPPVKTSGGIFNWRAFKFPPFLLYNLSVLVCFFGLYTRNVFSSLARNALLIAPVLTYIDVSATKAGIAPSFDVYLVSVANASSGVGRIFTGVLADRIGCMTVMIPGTLMVAVVTIAWPFARSLPALMVVAILYGCASPAKPRSRILTSPHHYHTDVSQELEDVKLKPNLKDSGTFKFVYEGKQVSKEDTPGGPRHRRRTKSIARASLQPCPHVCVVLFTGTTSICAPPNTHNTYFAVVDDRWRDGRRLGSPCIVNDVGGRIDARELAVDAPLLERAPDFVPDVPKSISKRSTLSLTVTHGGHAIALTVKSTTQMAKVISAAEAKFGRRLTCTFDGVRINPNDTPAHLDMRSGDRISC